MVKGSDRDREPSGERGSSEPPKEGWETLKLVEYGTAEELTRGIANPPLPDPGGFSA